MDQPQFPFNTPQDYHLISLVRLHPELYDPRDPSFLNLYKRMDSWRNIAKIMGKHPLWCVTQWDIHYNIYMERKKVLRELQEKLTKHWPITSAMNFLAQVPDAPDGVGQVLSSSANFASTSTASTGISPVGIPFGQGQLALTAPPTTHAMASCNMENQNYNRFITTLNTIFNGMGDQAALTLQVKILEFVQRTVFSSTQRKKVFSKRKM